VRDHTLLAAWKDHHGILGYVTSKANTQIAGMVLEGAMNLIPIFTMSHYPTLTKGGCSIQFVVRDQKPLARILGLHLCCSEQGSLGHDNYLLARVMGPGVSLPVSEHNPSPGTPQGRMRKRRKQEDKLEVRL
jgi:hypothetical protein